MQITEVRIKLLPRSNGAEKLRAFCTVTLDNEFVIRDLKIIEGARGAFIAMPSRKLMEKCSACGQKNAARSRFCNDCGAALRRSRPHRAMDGRERLYVDVAHPINAAARAKLHKRILEEFRSEEERAASGNYVYSDVNDEEFDGGYDPIIEESAAADDLRSNGRRPVNGDASHDDAEARRPRHRSDPADREFGAEA